MSDNTGSAKANTSEQSKDPSLNMNELRELAELVNEHGFTDFEFENENIRVRLSKAVQAAAVQPAPVFAAPAGASPIAASASAESEESNADPDAGLFKIISPIVGTFYSAPGPDKDPYVNVGSKVSPESIVCIVEAMKLMNEIQAEASGEIVKIYVENGQPVEYGQPLFGIKQ